MHSLSVLIAARGAHDVLPRAINSLLVQSIGPVEVVIASDDGTDYAGRLAERGLRVPNLKQVFTNPRRCGTSSALNLALEASSGEVIATLAPHDTYHPMRLEHLAPLAAEHGVAVDRVMVNHPRLGRYTSLDYEDRRGLDSLDADAILNSPVPLFFVARRDILAQGWPDGIDFAEDVMMNLELLSRAAHYPWVREAYYEYHVDASLRLHTPDSDLIADEGYERILGFLSLGEFDLTPDIRDYAEAGIRRKKAFNLAFSRARRAGLVKSFQEFVILTQHKPDALAKMWG